MRKILFRFFFIYFLFQIVWWFWFWLYKLPGISYLLDLYYNVLTLIVEFFNKYLFHVKETLNMNGGGSGDTSYAWAQFYAYILLSFIGCAIWSLVDRKRKDGYKTLGYWFRNLLRYNLAMFSFLYGVTKLFTLQMPFPDLSQLATPLGDFLPMRFSWMFIGYSDSYQIFSGLAETVVGLLFLNRKTVTLGALMGVGVFANVFWLNISYDIPVKLLSLQLLIGCMFLVASDLKRLFRFFVENKTTGPSSLYDIGLTKKWQKIGRWAFKISFVIYFVIMPFKDARNRYRSELKYDAQNPISIGIYDVKTFIKNGDTIPISEKDEMAWKDFIFDKNGIGSINTLDTLLRQRYSRGYFSYQPDTLKKSISFKKFAYDSTQLFEMKYKINDEGTIELLGKVRNDSIYFRIQKNNRHFRLAERQFHWISEANR